MPLKQTRLILDTPPEDQTPSMPYSILIASDDEPLVAAVTRSLHNEGFEVCTRTPPEDASSRENTSLRPTPWGDAHGPGPSLIVLDTDLSPEHRRSVLQAWREHPSAPIVALAPRAKVRQTAVEPGVWLCLPKPVHVKTLLTAITQIARYTAAT
jgi:DNA-binding response OmpR family regulator